MRQLLEASRQGALIVARYNDYVQLLYFTLAEQRGGPRVFVANEVGVADIVSYLHRNSQRIVSKKELLTEVWQYADAGIETRTVDIHMLKLRKKISALAGDGPFITTVRGEGYRLDTAT